MDFCLHVVIFSQFLISHSATCFDTEMERNRYTHELRVTEKRNYLVNYRNLEELKRDYVVLLEIK